MTTATLAADGIFETWPAHLADVWGHAPVKLRHRLHLSPLLSMAALACGPAGRARASPGSKDEYGND